LAQSGSKACGMIYGAVAAAISVCLAACSEQPAVVPDLSGIWARNAFEFEVPAFGPGPLTNLSRKPDGTSADALVGDYGNPILKPAAAERVKQLGELSRSGIVYSEPGNQCWPWPLPFMLRQINIQILQQPDQVTIFYRNDNQVRRVRMNASHPARVTPSWYGDSIGRYEGDTLVIDTVGIKVGPFAMIDAYGTPYSKALHVVERYRLVDYAAAKEAIERHETKNGILGPNITGVEADLDYRGKGLQIEITFEDANVFTTAWTALVTYRRAASAWQEYICAENARESVGGDRKVPTAETPDF
jgi:hypothetical protein